MNRDDTLQTLIENARKISIDHQSIIESFDGIVKANINNKEMFIPGYVPYIGEGYFEASTKIMIYALSQNLSPTDDISIEWAKNWQGGDTDNNATNRQNINFNKCGKVMMHPFDTGHLPVVAGILDHLLNPITKRSQDIFKSISATNLSKFSFRDGNKTTDNSKSLRKCFEWFSIKEIEALRPDYIICAGDDVCDVIKGGINGVGGPHPSIIRVDFPSLQVINSKFKNKSIKNDDEIVQRILSDFPDIVLNKESSYENKKTIREIIERDRNYFAAMYDSIKKQI
ncbi:MAG: hypothetical protein U9O65_08305 [Thermotogota bacterium]|nr:hypothetical protein [Thermotogota bacterium]